MIPKRFERLTHALEGRCSIQLSYGTILNCGAKVRSFAETCKKKETFFAFPELWFDFLPIEFGTGQYFLDEIEGFPSSEITVLAYRIVKILFITFQ